MVQKLIKFLINFLGPSEEIRSSSQKHSFDYLRPNFLAPKGVPRRMTCHSNDLDPKPHVKPLGPNFKFLTNRIALFHFQIGPRPWYKLGISVGAGSSWYGSRRLGTYVLSIFKDSDVYTHIE